MLRLREAPRAIVEQTPSAVARLIGMFQVVAGR
jgi:hypothetical protein